MIKLNSRRKQAGIGLLELMLSMVIIAIMTLMAIQYFSSSKRNTLTTKGVDEIQDIVSIVGGIPNASGITGGTSGGSALDSSGCVVWSIAIRVCASVRR